METTFTTQQVTAKNIKMGDYIISDFYEGIVTNKYRPSARIVWITVTDEAGREWSSKSPSTATRTVKTV